MRRTSLICTMLFFAFTNCIAQDVANADSVVEESKDSLAAKMSPLEFTQELVIAEPSDQYSMLPLVNPRGVDPKSKSAIVRLLIPLLREEHPDIRARTATAISLFGKESEQAIPELLNLIGDNRQTARLASVWSIASKALDNIGTASIQPCMEKLETAEGWEFFGATAVIAELGDHTEAQATAPYFLEHLKNGPEGHKWATAFCLSKLGDAAKPAIADYIDLLDHPKFNLQVIACRGLAALEKDAKVAVPKLVELTNKKGNMLSTRTHAAMCLGAIGPVEGSGVDLVALFKSMISEPNAFCQERGLIALGRLGEHGAEAAPFVVDLLADSEFSQRPEAALALWKISGDAERTIEFLKPIMNDPTYDSRTLDAIKEMGPAAAALAEPLVARLDTDDASLQLTIVQILEDMGPAGHRFIEAFRPLADTAPPDIGIQLDKIVASIESASHSE